MGCAVAALCLAACDLDAPGPDPFHGDTGSGGGVGADDTDAELDAAGADAGPTLPDCLDLEDPGNELGVGRICEGAADCADAPRARFCMTDFLPTDPVPVCTFPCTGDAECGDDAICLPPPEDPEGTAMCRPEACVEVNL